ncbi:MAG TPA: dipeptidase [Candidatus Angelobacter sp.]|jgi:microsomal dipeptidase-like Zn-dependent dipeptidase
MKRLRWVILLLLLVALIAWFALPGIVEHRFNKTLHAGPYPVPVEARELHRRLVVADLHADSLLWGRNLLGRSSAGHVDLPRLAEGNVAIQAFTVVTTSPRGLNIYKNSEATDNIKLIAMFEGWPPRTWNSPKQRALYQAERLRNFVRHSKGELVLIRSRKDLEEFLAARDAAKWISRSGADAVAGFLGSEGAQPLEGDLKNLDDLYAAGFRMMAPTHFTDTTMGGSAAGVNKGGLTPLGREWVRAMEAHKMIIDLAHASPATLRDVTAMATRPLLVSHTGVKGTCDNPRNLSDDELRAVARTGGVSGIGVWDTATCGSDAQATARAIRYAVKVVGVEHVALGSDFDGGTTTPFDSSGWVLVTEALMKEGFSEAEIRKIMGENVVRFLMETLP